MSRAIAKRESIRYRFEFDKIPTFKIGPRSLDICNADDYGCIIDNVIDMADAVSTSNGVSVASAIETVCKDEGWKVLNSHKKRIIEFLNS